MEMETRIGIGARTGIQVCVEIEGGGGIGAAAACHVAEGGQEVWLMAGTSGTDFE